MIIYANIVLSQEPILYWKLDDISVVPRVFHDSSGFGRHHIFPSFARPEMRLPGAFPGDFAVRPTTTTAYSTSALLLRDGAPWTLAFYHYTEPGFTTPYYVGAVAAQSTLDGSFVRIEHHSGADGKAWVLATGAREIFVDPGPPGWFGSGFADDRWWHLALRYDGAGTLAWFRDGVKIGEVAQAIVLPATGNFQLRWSGAWGTQSTTRIGNVSMNSRYSEIALYDKALDDAFLEWLAFAFEARTIGVTADGFMTTTRAPLVSRGYWLGGERTFTIGGADLGEFRFWFGGDDAIELPMLGEYGRMVNLRADGVIPLEITANAFAVTAPELSVVSDAIIQQDGFGLRADGYVVPAGGRAAPLPAAGRVRPRIPAGRAAARIPGA